jgi:ElaB/YqjD/DUF883 family membrane-anchored ribosome-binding protein
MAVEYLEKTATLDDVVREISKIKAMVAEAVDDGVRSAMRAARKGSNAARNAVEDALEDGLDKAKTVVRQNPLETLGIAVAAIAVAGGLLAWLSLRRR